MITETMSIPDLVRAAKSQRECAHPEAGMFLLADGCRVGCTACRAEWEVEPRAWRDMLSGIRARISRELRP